MERHLDERLALLAPWLTRRFARLVLALPPGSSLRRRAVMRASARVWDALSRGDDEVILLAFDPEIEFNIIGGYARALGLAEHYRGHQGWLQFIALWRAEWGGKQVRHTPETVIDLGDRIVTRVTVAARGATSGADVALSMGIVSWIRDGAIVRQDNYVEWRECAGALGLADVAPAASA